jgi:hypothetical protein
MHIRKGNGVLREQVCREVGATPNSNRFNLTTAEKIHSSTKLLVDMFFRAGWTIIYEVTHCRHTIDVLGRKVRFEKPTEEAVMAEFEAWAENEKRRGRVA